MPISSLPLACLLLPVPLAFACYSEIRWRRIPNWLTFAMMVFGLGAGLLEGDWPGARDALVGLAVGGGVFLPFCLMGALGGGDMKLMAGVGAMVGWPLVLPALAQTCLAGGILAVVAMVWHGRVWSTLANAGIDLLNTFGDQRSLTAILLLSGSSMGYAGTPGNEMGDLLNLILLKPLDELAKGSKDGFDLSQAFSEAMSGASASGISGLSDGISELLMTAIVKPVIGAVGSALLTPVVGWAQTQLNNLGKKISGALDQKGGEFSAMKHYARNLQKAYQRVAYVSAGKGKKGGPIVKVYTANDGDIAFLAPSGTIRQPHVHTAKGTDPGLAGQLAYVRVRWPMASDWLFPLFWGGERADTGVWATGHALTLLEPTLTNDNLKSTDPKAYTPRRRTPRANTPASPTPSATT